MSESPKDRVDQEQDARGRAGSSADAVELDRSVKLDSVLVGMLVGFAEDGAPLVDFEASSEEATAARATVDLSIDQIGSEVTLVFEGGDPKRPIVLGVLRSPSASQVHSDTSARGEALRTLGESSIDREQGVSVRSDGERVTIQADREIELRCGKASIVLTRAGKVLIKGAYLSSRSSGTNRIKGGSVQIN